MSLLRKRKRSSRRRVRGLRTYTTVRCPLAGHQVGWCRGLCTPVGTQGLCGRVAPHSLQGRTQRAISEYQERQARGADPDAKKSLE